MLPTSGISAADLISLVTETLVASVATVSGVVLVRISRGAFVSHVGVETGPPISGVSDDLRPAIRKLHPILAANGLAVARLLPTEIVAGSMVLHGVAELIGLGLKQSTNDRGFPFVRSSQKSTERKHRARRRERGDREDKECEM